MRDWLDSLEDVLRTGGPKKAQRLLRELQMHILYKGIRLPFTANTPYVNSIHHSKQVPYPGNRDLERRIRSIIRWNAMAMVVRANRAESGIGGHISTYASAATLWEVGFNHFWHGKDDPNGGDIVYFQGHGSPGIYARAFLEGRLSEQQLENFRRELRSEGGVASYPHPWLMPRFWEFPTVSMGLAPLMAIYQARFNRYLQDRGIKQTEGQKVWALLGDGEIDEPEALGAISLAAREKLSNLIFVINCNLQRLDGPVRGNGKIIQELEAGFRGAGWNAIKVVWGDDWDPLFDSDKDGILLKRVEEIPDGQWQKYSVSDGAYIREDFCKVDPRLQQLVAHLSNEQIQRLNRGGHDMVKVYNAFKAALDNKAAPTVILAKTIKGYGLGESGEGKNITHQQKKLNEEELREFRSRFGIPISDDEVSKAPFYKPPPDSPEMIYLRERRKALGGSLPERRVQCPPLKIPGDEFFEEFTKGTEGREVSTTMVYVRILGKLLRDKDLGRLVVPIVPDEARTFGMEALFRQVGIYSHVGQTYEPVDKDQLVYYKEAKDGQILEEGITEAGSMSSFIAAGTSYATHGISMIPFFTFYSMFGLQRIGDLIWAAGDMRTKGFLVGATSGRTTLNGEGLQHQDGHSHLLAYPVPNLTTYDPAYAYELAVIIRDGLRRMYEAQEDVFYYITVTNENYDQPAMPAGAKEGILKGLYRVRASELGNAKARAQLLGSGSILNEALKAQKLLAEKYGVGADVWSVTSYKELRRDAMTADRWNLLHPGEPQKEPYVTQCLKDAPGPVVATSDYVKALPDSIARWIPQGIVSLGTDGFGRSETREKLREFFEIDHRFVALGALAGLARQGKLKPDVARQAMKDLGIDPAKANPMIS
ncbi:MAG TPA: pyruvate dehydrogenase (acetyl-transferring), homodimeric type [Planctomycetota bacterium]|nr:pyruvate dehydrogenase (acetyl-transferring), homodimeric type [Planctomycetota bacterium]